MRRVAIIQARMDSTRLPGKSVKLLCGIPLIRHVVERVQRAETIDAVVLAMPVEGRRTALLIEAVQGTKVKTFVHLGATNDLIRRYQTAADFYNADVIVRVPGDNPCVDPEQIDRIVTYHSQLDTPVGMWLTSNLERNQNGNGYPGGIGAEVYDSWFLHWLDQNVDDPELREHPHMWATQQKRVRTVEAMDEVERPKLRFDVNTQEDFDYISDIYEHVYPKNNKFLTSDVLDYLDSKQRKIHGTSVRSK